MITIEGYQLSPHFNLDEMVRTSHRKYLYYNKKESIEYLDNLHDLCTQILEPVRILLDSPIIINSGFRCKKLNKIIGGSKKSQHTVGEAADIVFPFLNQSLKEIYNKIAFSSIRYSQIIYEFGQWIHIGLQDNNLYPDKMNQKLIAYRIKGKTVYTLISEPI